MKVKKVYMIIAMMVFLVAMASLIYPHTSLHQIKAEEAVDGDSLGDSDKTGSEGTDSTSTTDETIEIPTEEIPEGNPLTTESTTTTDDNTTENPTTGDTSTENPTATDNTTSNPTVTSDTNTGNPTTTDNSTSNPTTTSDISTENPTTTNNPAVTSDNTTTSPTETNETPANKPVEPIIEPTVPEVVFNIEELKARFLDIFIAKMATLENEYSDKDSNVIDALVEDIMNQYNNDATLGLELLEKINTDDEYAYTLLVSEYNKIIEEKLPFVESDYVADEITDYVSSDVEGDMLGSIMRISPFALNLKVYENYINSLTHEVKYEQAFFEGTKIDKFRQYDVSLGIDIENNPISAQASNADITLLIDNSGSMTNNLDVAKNSAIKFIETLMPVDYFKDEPNAIKVSVISFSNNTQIMQRQSSNREDIINSIKRISAPASTNDSTIQGTNIQHALLTAADNYGITDTDRDLSSNGRKKIIVIFTDGVATSRSTDIWSFSQDPFKLPTADFQYSDKAQGGRKRFSYAVPGVISETDPIKPKINLPDGSSFDARVEEVGNGTTNQKQKEFTDRVTVLEAQHLVGQGVELYTVAFNEDTEARQMLADMSKKMTDVPQFKPSDFTGTTGLKESPIRDGNGNAYTYTVQNVQGHNFESTNVLNLIKDVASDITSDVVNNFKPYVITDVLADEFEFSDVKFTVSKQPFGQEVIKDSKWNNATLQNSTLTWTAPDTFTKGTYYINFKVKVKETPSLKYGNYFSKGAGKEIYGQLASESAKISKMAQIKFFEANGTQQSFDFYSPKTYVQPNLNISLTTKENVILAGESAIISPVVESGTGYYNYKVYEKPNIANGNQEVVLAKNAKYNETDLSKPTKLDEAKRLYTKGVKSNLVFEVTDRLSMQTVMTSLEMDVRVAKLIINILDDANGNSLAGAFETKVSAKIKNTVDDKLTISDEVYYLMGLGQRQFTYESNASIKRGSEFSVKSYVPYGYIIDSVTDSDGDKDGKVVIDLKKNASDQWSGYEQTITIKVKKKTPEPNYFFDWTWILNK